MENSRQMPLRLQKYLLKKKIQTKNETKKQQQKFYGQHQEDVYIKSLFPDNYTGVCVDVGAYDGVNMSNTYYFEKNGWRCLCIEPILEEYQKCKSVRKECANICAGKEDLDQQKFTVFSLGLNKSAISSLSPDPQLVMAHKGMITSSEERIVPVRTLVSILQNHNFPKKIDFISIDTEGTELDVLMGINLDLYDVYLFVIENNFNHPACEDYLKNFGYTKIKRIAVNDFFVKQSSC